MNDASKEESGASSEVGTTGDKTVAKRSRATVALAVNPVRVSLHGSDCRPVPTSLIVPKAPSIEGALFFLAQHDSDSQPQAVPKETEFSSSNLRARTRLPFRISLRMTVAVVVSITAQKATRSAIDRLARGTHESSCRKEASPFESTVPTNDCSMH